MRLRKKIKVIQIAPVSHSYFASKKDDREEIKKIILNDWYTKVSIQLKRLYPEIEVECWAPEKLNKQEERVVWGEVKFRFFPVTFSPRYALDFSTAMLKALKKEIRKSKEQNYRLILHIHEIHNLHGLLIASLFGKEKLIVQHHGGSWPLKHLRQTKEYRLFFPFFLFGQMWENKILKNIDAFFALSQEEIAYLKKITNSKIKFQTMGIEDVYFKTISKKTARKKLKLPENKKTIIFIGRVNEVKGIPYLLKAMKKLKDVELKIIGFGEVERFKKEVRKNNLKNVEVLGPVFGGKKLLYLSAADALVLPSSKEGAPVSVMEAVARNLPVVVSDVGGIRLMIKDRREGIIIRQKNSDDIVKAVREILKWEKNIKRYAKRYRWKEIIKETVKEYRR